MVVMNVQHVISTKMGEREGGRPEWGGTLPLPTVCLFFNPNSRVEGTWESLLKEKISEKNKDRFKAEKKKRKSSGYQEEHQS